MYTLMLYRFRLSLVRALILSLVGCSSACTTLRHKPDRLADVKVAAPAECTKAHFASYPWTLALLPSGFGVLVIEEQARAVVTNKSDDAHQYGALLANALRCAPEK
jgi:hypothetical protein